MASFSSADPRTSARGEWLFDQIVATGSLVVRDLGGGRDGEIGAHRYLSSPYVSVAIIVEALSERTRLVVAGRRVVVAQSLPPRSRLCENSVGMFLRSIFRPSHRARTRQSERRSH